MELLTRIVEIKTIPGVTAWIAKTGLSGGVIMRGSIPNVPDESNPHARATSVLLAELFDEETQSYGRTELRDKLQSLGATVSFTAKVSSMEFQVTALSERLEEVCGLLFEMLYRPQLSNGDLHAVRSKVLGQLVETKFDTQVRAREVLIQHLYKEESPLYVPTFAIQYAALKQVTRKDVTARHKKLLRDGELRIIVAGDIAPTRVAGLLRKFLKGKGEGKVGTVEAKLANVQKTNPHNTQIVTIPNRASVDVFWGLVPGILKTSPDFLPLVVGLQILGGGFMGRLMQEIREKRGLTYGIYANLSSFESGLPGYWFVWGTFAPQTFREGVKQVESVLLKFVKDGVTLREVRTKKERLMGAHKLSLGSTEELSAVLLTLLEDGRTPDYLETYLKEIAMVTVDSTIIALRKYCDPQRLVNVASGSIDVNGLPLTGKKAPAKL